MYSNFDFCMYWEDLPEEYRAGKLDEIIIKRYNDENFRLEYPKEIPIGSLAEVLENEEIRNKIEAWVIAHFPVYF